MRPARYVLEFATQLKDFQKFDEKRYVAYLEASAKIGPVDARACATALRGWRGRAEGRRASRAPRSRPRAKQ